MGRVAQLSNNLKSMSLLQGAYTKGVYFAKTLLDAVTETTTSAAINVAGARRITLAFTRANHSSGSTAFTVEGTIDGSTWIALNLIVKNVTNTNAQTLTRVSSVSLSSNTSELVGLDLEGLGLLEIRVVATETTDGTHTAKALIEY